MEQQIYKATPDFDFDKLHLAQPTSLPGNAFFSMFQYNKSPLYIELPSCFTKQRFVKSAKKMYVDLVFSSGDANFISWLEALESKCCKLLFAHSKPWFTEDLALEDIESVFISPLKSYKSGNNYLLRIYTSPTEGETQLYDEAENNISYEDIQENTNNVSIAEFLGIKFTTRYFQIEIELKQLMVIKPKKKFERCLIKPPQETTLTNFRLHTSASDSFKPPSILDVVEEDGPMLADSLVLFPEPAPPPPTQAPPLNIDSELCEFDINTLTENAVPMTLKKPNEVYYKLYKDAKQKAKKAREDALVAILEAKNIKQTYMLTDMSDDEEEDDIDLLKI